MKHQHLFRFTQDELNRAIEQNVQAALLEDVSDAKIDITAQLIPADKHETARIITRENMVLAGRPWAQKVFELVDSRMLIKWQAKDGDKLRAGSEIARLSGNARSLMTAERIALNFLQTLSGVATKMAVHVKLLEGLPAKLLDTRKTLPGLRIAQKYATIQGGGYNHRIGLYDAFLIKENHIAACGSISAAVAQARTVKANAPVEVEIENFTQLHEALAVGADIIMLDNFTTEDMAKAVKQVAGRCKLEASGDITADNLREVASTGVDYISMGALTKHVRAIDLSMRVT